MPIKPGFKWKQYFGEALLWVLRGALFGVGFVLGVYMVAL